MFSPYMRLVQNFGLGTASLDLMENRLTGFSKNLSKTRLSFESGS
jgi:hypothetical protein